jgi:hypothetical protein
MADKKRRLAIPSQGWRQFLTARAEMLAAFDSARTKAKAHEVETYHGKVAEAELRSWLSSFLPKRYGVTPGYIVSQGMKSETKAPHFDVIIYDALESPVLWIEGDPDQSKAGRSMAIPAEFALGVLEVKATMTAQSTRKAIEHLSDLKPLMQGFDTPSDRYKLYLPDRFYCGIVHFQLCKNSEHSESALSSIMGGVELRGFLGGLVLRGEGHSLPFSGRMSLLNSKNPIKSTIGKNKQSLLDSSPLSATVKVTEELHLGTMLSWTEFAFSQFAFDILAIMQGTYEQGRVSSFYGLGSSKLDAGVGE